MTAPLAVRFAGATNVADPLAVAGADETLAELVYTGAVKVAEPEAVAWPADTTALPWYTTVAKMAVPLAVAGAAWTVAEAVKVPAAATLLGTHSRLRRNV